MQEIWCTLPYIDLSKSPHTPAMDTFNFWVLLYEMYFRRLPTGMFNVSTLQWVHRRVLENNFILLIAACVNHNKQLLDVLVWIKYSNCTIEQIRVASGMDVFIYNH